MEIKISSQWDRHYVFSDVFFISAQTHRGEPTIPDKSPSPHTNPLVEMYVGHKPPHSPEGTTETQELGL